MFQAGKRKVLNFFEPIKIHPGIIGFDIDGVVADTAGAFIRIACERNGLAPIFRDEITEFNVASCLDIDPAVIDEIFLLLVEDPVGADLRPIPDAVQVLCEFSKVAPLTFVTARPCKEPVAKWLLSVLGKDVFDGATLVVTGEHDSKIQYIKRLGLKYFVDDRAETCILLAKEDITPLVFEQPWNRGKHQLPVVQNWRAIKKLCLGPTF